MDALIRPKDQGGRRHPPSPLTVPLWVIGHGVDVESLAGMLLPEARQMHGATDRKVGAMMRTWRTTTGQGARQPPFIMTLTL